MAVERVLSNLNLIKFKTEGGLQNHIDELQDGDLVFTPDNSLKGNLFDFKWTDHKLNDISWLNADTFSWQSGDVYEAAYNHLAEDCKVYAWQYAPTQGGDIGYTTTEIPAVGGVLMIGGNACNITEVGSDYVVAEHYKTGEARTYQRVAGSDSTAFVAGILSTETVDHITITFFRAKDGHKICSASQEENVRNLYDWMGVAWYYVLDEENKQFKLPRTKHAFTGLRDSVGGYVKAGLPNITGEWYSNAPSNYTTSGAIYSKVVSATNVPTTIGSGKYGFGFDASRSSSVYGNSNTVQPEATQMYLYFYVGNFERDAVEQTAGITAEMFNNKADVTRVVALEERDYVVSSQEPTSANGYTWYRKYKSGWCEQGGTKKASIKTITLPIVMKNNGYQGQVTGGDNNYSINYIMRDLTTTSCVVTARTTGGNDFDNWYGYWQVSGYAA